MLTPTLPRFSGNRGLTPVHQRFARSLRLVNLPSGLLCRTFRNQHQEHRAKGDATNFCFAATHFPATIGPHASPILLNPLATFLPAKQSSDLKPVTPTQRPKAGKRCGRTCNRNPTLILQHNPASRCNNARQCMKTTAYSRVASVLAVRTPEGDLPQERPQTGHARKWDGGPCLTSRYFARLPTKLPLVHGAREQNRSRSPRTRFQRFTREKWQRAGEHNRSRFVRIRGHRPTASHSMPTI